jgi:hypothetical protein
MSFSTRRHNTKKLGPQGNWLYGVSRALQEVIKIFWGYKSGIVTRLYLLASSGFSVGQTSGDLSHILIKEGTQ